MLNRSLTTRLAWLQTVLVSLEVITIAGAMKRMCVRDRKSNRVENDLFQFLNYLRQAKDNFLHMRNVKLH